jgi:magnesium-protoporphyrin IX monomethyl ester (oxidative) cyclase
MRSSIEDHTDATAGTLSLKLINMPFADWYRPSFALSQLAAFVQRELADEIDMNVYHLNLDFAAYFGGELYEAIARESGNASTGIGDWIFSQIAFPESGDNSGEYFKRYYVGSPAMKFRERILDMRSRLEQFCIDLINRYELATADIIGFTSMFAQNAASLALARLIKERNPDATIVMGGANCETPMGAVLVENFPAIDFAFSGPALNSFLDFLRCKLQGDEKGLHEIRGVLSKENSKDTRARAAIGHDHDIDDYFDPDYESFIEAFDKNKESITSSLGLKEDVKPLLYFETSRGCWWGQRSHCTFCGLNGQIMGYKSMSPDNALRQFRSLFEYAPWCLDYHCTDNILPKNYPDDVFRVLDPPPGSSIFYEVKLPVSEKDLQTLANANVNKVQPGIEALSTSTLKLMGKGTTAFQNIQFLKNTVKLDIQPAWNLLIGFPGEDENTYRKYQQDIPLLRHLPPPSGVFVVRFDRYSPYFTRSSEYDLDLRPMDFYPFVYPLSSGDLAELAYFFQDHNISPYAVNAARWFRPLSESIKQWKEGWTGAGRQSSLVLQRRPDGTHVIHDSRGRISNTYGVDEETAAILHRLSSPIRSDRIASEFGITSEAASDRLSFLRANDLLFEEGDRIMSLVIAEADQDSLPAGLPDAATSSGTKPGEMDAPAHVTLLPITEVRIPDKAKTGHADSA